MSVIRQDNGTLQTPTYEASEYEWIKGIYDVSRVIMVIYNPVSTGGVSTLDERANGMASGLGLWEMRLSSDVVGSLTLSPSVNQLIRPSGL
jgi:hypothetical protein